MSQSERDRLEEERIARARAEREAQLSGRTSTLVVSLWKSVVSHL